MIKITILLLFLSAAFATDCSKPSQHYDPIFLNESHHTGYVPLNDNRGSLFYWLFESRRSPSKDSLLLYLHSGFGQASQIPVFFENGPYRLNEDNTTLRTNPYSYNNIANVLYVDNALGNGFSVAKSADAIPSSAEQSADDLFYFLKQFLKQNPNFRDRDLYIMGGSYNTKTAPVLCNIILDHKKELRLNLKGFQIIGPILFTKLIYPTWPEFAYENNLINRTFYKDLEKRFEPIKELLGHTDNEHDLMEASDQAWTIENEIVGDSPTYNPVNILNGCSESDGLLCTDISGLTTFITQPLVLSALNITEGTNWTALNGSVSSATSYSDFNGNRIPDLSKLVQRGLPGVVSCGEGDFLWNCIAAEDQVASVKWSGQKKFNGMKHTVWKDYGEYKHLDNLTFMEVYGCGHWCGMDAPKAMLAIFKRLVEGW